MSDRKVALSRSSDILTLSLLGGSVCGLCAMMGLGEFALGALLVAAVIGGLTGLIVSPVPLFAVMWRPLGKSFGLMVVPSMAVAYGTAFLGHSLLSTFLSVPVFIGMAFVAMMCFKDIRTPPDPDLCVNCGYSLEGLSDSPHRRCPECGQIEETRNS